jgi:hypothetical protein
MRNSRWVRLLAYVTGSVNQELLLRNEYVATENRILRAKLPARLRFSDPVAGELPGTPYSVAEPVSRRRMDTKMDTKTHGRHAYISGWLGVRFGVHFSTKRGRFGGFQRL